MTNIFIIPEDLYGQACLKNVFQRFELYVKNAHEYCVLDLDAFIEKKFSLHKSNFRNVKEQFEETLNALKHHERDIIIASSFHPDIVRSWLKDNCLSNFFNKKILMLPRDHDPASPNRMETPDNFSETPAMKECPQNRVIPDVDIDDLSQYIRRGDGLPHCGYDNPAMGRSLRIIQHKKKYENDLLEFFFHKPHRRCQRLLHSFDIYDRYFSSFRETDVGILEIGIASGGGLQMWKNYFGKYSQIYGIDIRPAAMFEENQIKCYLGDQADQEFLDRVIKDIPKLDIVVDDGGHSMKEQINSFIKIFPHLIPGGLYLVEDLVTSYHPAGKYGNENKDDTFIAIIKNLVDEINRELVSEELAGDVGPGYPQAKETASLHVYPGMVIIEKSLPISQRKFDVCDIQMVGHAVLGMPGPPCQTACPIGCNIPDEAIPWVNQMRHKRLIEKFKFDFQKHDGED